MHSGISTEDQQVRITRGSFAFLKERPGKKATAIIRLDIPGSQVEEVLSKLPGIRDFSVNHVSGTLRVDYDPEEIDSDKIRKFVNKQI